MGRRVTLVCPQDGGHGVGGIGNLLKRNVRTFPPEAAASERPGSTWPFETITSVESGWYRFGLRTHRTPPPAWPDQTTSRLACQFSTCHCENATWSISANGVFAEALLTKYLTSPVAGF